MAFSSIFVLLLIVIAIFLIDWSSAAEQSYQRISLDMHNAFRKKHHVDALSLSVDLNTQAIKCAQYYANKGQIDHSCPHKKEAGENLFAQFGGSSSDDDVAKGAANAWYSEVAKHDYNKDWQPNSGHFSQIVWKSGKQLGFGVGRKGSMIVGCALYSPHGNMMKQFKQNVLKP